MNQLLKLVLLVLQTLPTQFASLTPTDSRMNVESYDHWHPPQPTTSPLHLPELVAAYFEKKEEFLGSWPTLKSVNGLSEPLNALREEGGSTRNVHEKEPSPDLQVYRSSEHHGLPKPQQGELSASLSCTLHNKVMVTPFARKEVPFVTYDHCKRERSPIHVCGNNPNVKFNYLSTR